MNDRVHCSDLLSMAAQISASPTRAEFHEGELADMLRGTRAVQSGIFERKPLPTHREPAWTFAADVDGEAVAGGRVNAMSASDAMHEVAKIIAQDELNGSGNSADGIVVTLNRLG